MWTKSYWYDHVRKASGTTDATSIISKKNDTGQPIKIISCIASSSGAVSTEGISFFTVKNDESIPIHHDKAALTAKETCACQVHFILQADESIKVTFDKPAAATDVLELIISGE